MSWNVRWGVWEATCNSSNRGYEAFLRAETNEKGVIVRGPTEKGMCGNVRDAMNGIITITLRAPNGTILLDTVRCATAQVETGGEWTGNETWIVDVPKLPQPLRSVVNLFDTSCAITT